MGIQKARGTQQLTGLGNTPTGSYQHLGNRWCHSAMMPAAVPCPLILALLREDSGEACGELALEPKGKCQQVLPTLT